MLKNNNSKKIRYLSHLFLFFISAHVILLHTMEKQNYLPIILVSGVSANEDGMNPMIELIRKYISLNIYVRHVEIGWGEITSFWNMDDQAADLALALIDDANLRDGFNIVAHSQGGVVARCLIERYNFPVHNYIALGSPQRGVCGIPTDTLHPYLHYLEPYIASLLYRWPFQSCLSIADYWNDPLQHEAYLKYCTFLPYINNEKQHEHSDQFKNHITRLQNMILVQSSEEYVVEPPISCHFGFYKNGSTTETEDLFESEIFKNDTLGLKTLHDNKRLHLLLANCYHTKFESDEKNFLDNVLPYLTLTKDETIIEAVEKERQ